MTPRQGGSHDTYAISGVLVAVGAAAVLFIGTLTMQGAAPCASV